MSEAEADLEEPIGVDLSAWAAPPPPHGLARRVCGRLQEAVAVAAEPPPDVAPAASRRVRTSLLAGAGIALAAGAAAAFVMLAPNEQRPSSGELVAVTARHVAFGGVRVDADPRAELSWRRDGRRVAARQGRGNATWSISSSDVLELALGGASAPPMALAASDARVRVEVAMNPSDARVIKASAATSAVVALATVIVYEGHIKATSGQVTVNLGPGDVARLAPGQAPAVPDLVAAKTAPSEGNELDVDASSAAPASAKDAVVRIDDCDPGAGTLELYTRPTVGQPEIIAVGIYEAQGGEAWWAAAEREAGSNEPDEETLERHRNTHRLQRATVKDTRSAPHLLVLTSYEPTEWKLDLSGANVTRIVVQGYHRSFVVGAGDIPVDVRSGEAGDERASYAYQTVEREERERGKVDEGWVGLNADLQATYGASISYFAGCYQGSKVVVR